ncbi:hypothetical protein Pst134EA_017496 [Puccinia striiformis f. sp. tritici]|uniref:Uncharacterized protein n=2 Tax=Puccinia striiformis TaxID=27350 RepID=A0A2S4VLX6_9BASI|nr:hypothetical protein Pst134EA_017496 [Puccinia striiformis f. sp. tritici]KAH9461186.1 hypothetical protein Pst134EA_017496 [Puccinia striiformis f. sp. tritici]KAI9615306.1 hypothetical protein KEM48_005735 [Puccinia striiformis f. sp. tritici PST-130]POW10564.1 hypothetical protein PSTT_06019 [Puccinia striiformis]POW18201.1 hypothetical protein PSHT_06098 [Puccinia striiformis]
MESDPLFPPDFPTHLRRFTRHITAVQTRGIDNSSTDLLFATHASDHTPPPSSYAPAHDSYDLQLHPVRTFRPNLLIDNIERLFISVVPLWSAGINEVTRLTTWSDPNRTAVWALLYSLCWWYELVLPAILALIICLSVWPKRAGSILFPPEKVTLPLTGDRARTQDKPELTDPSSDEVAEAAAAAAATFIHGVDSQVPLGSPSTEGSMKMQADSLEKASSKLKEPKAEKKNLSQQYKPVVYKYGGGIQNIAGDLCDIHERLRNLFTRRFIPPPRRLQHSSPAHHQTLGEVEPGMDANVRFALPFIPIFFLSIILPTQTLGRCVTFALGFAFFLLDPIQTRSKLVRDALDANQTILKGVPTDRAFVLATLRSMQQRHDGGLDIAMKLLKKENPPELPQRKRTSDEEVDSDAVSTLSSNPASGSSPRSVLSISKSGSSQLSRTSSLTSPSEERHQKLVKLAQKINRVTERGTQMLNQASYQSSQIMNGNRPISVDLSALLPNKSRKASTGSDSASVTSHSRQQAKTDKLLRAINESRPTNSAPGTLIDEGEFLSNSNSPFDPARNSSSFFCYYGNMPGHLTIHFSRTPVSRPNLSFYSGLGQSFKVRKSLIVIPLSQIVAMRKVSMLSLAGVWGGIDGIEFYEKRFRDPTEDDGSSDRNASRTKLKHHTFRNMTGRDEAFLKLLVLKDWDENEKPGWISV